MRPACLPPSQREVHHEALPPRPAPRPAPRRAPPQSGAGEHENIRLAVGQLAGFPARRSLAGLLARTVRYLWIAIRGFIGIGRILRDTPARIVCALIICRLRRGIRARPAATDGIVRLAREYLRRYTLKNRARLARVYSPFSFSPRCLPPRPPRRIGSFFLGPSSCAPGVCSFIVAMLPFHRARYYDRYRSSQRGRIFRLSVIQSRDIVFCGTRGFFLTRRKVRLNDSGGELVEYSFPRNEYELNTNYGIFSKCIYY